MHTCYVFLLRAYLLHRGPSLPEQLVTLVNCCDFLHTRCRLKYRSSLSGKTSSIPSITPRSYLSSVVDRDKRGNIEKSTGSERRDFGILASIHTYLFIACS